MATLVESVKTSDLPAFSNQFKNSFFISHPHKTKPGSIDPKDEAPTLQPVDNAGSPVAQSPPKVQATLLEEDPFSSEASKILFDGVDELRKCDAAVHLGLPELVIVGSQSAGKSSLLRSLTDIPFPVGDGLCTQFATRIISRRSAPDAPDVVKVSVERGKSTPFDGQSHNQKEPFSLQLQSLTPKAFEEIFKQARDYMGLGEKKGMKSKNFSSDILKIELHGPSRSHFGILDVPGIFQAATGTVTKEERARVEAMVISHMKEPESIIICVAPANGDLANQGIFELAKLHADTSRVVGVFTKCDKVDNPRRIVQIVRDNKEIALHNGWFVVQNLPEGASSTMSREEQEKATFSSGPWLEIPARQRGTTELKRFLAQLLSSRIRKAFPEAQRRLRELLAEEQMHLKTFGNERLKAEQRRDYIHNIVLKYQDLARDALTAPERLPTDEMKLRGLTQKIFQEFAKTMEREGHFYNFVDVGKTEDELKPSMTPLYKEIQSQISVNRGEELAGMTNPAVVKPLFVKQSSKWQSIGEKYLDEMVTTSKNIAFLILDHVCLEFGAPDHTTAELKATINEFEAKAREIATFKLQEFCNKSSIFPLISTDNEFKDKVVQAQHARFTAALRRYVLKYPSESFTAPVIECQNPKSLPKLQQLINGWVIVDTAHINNLFEEIHPRATRNTEDEIHDVLKAYYEVARGHFNNHVIGIMENFLQESQGPVLGLSGKYLLSLSEEQLNVLGGEDASVVDDRRSSNNRIKVLEEAVKIAGETWKKSMQV